MLYRPEWDKPAKFTEWMAKYHDRLSGVSGYDVESLFLPSLALFEVKDRVEMEAQNRAYIDDLYKTFLTGADAVDAADELIKGWPPYQRENEGKQSAEDFRKEWRDEQAYWGDE